MQLPVLVCWLVPAAASSCRARAGGCSLCNREALLVVVGGEGLVPSGAAEMGEDWSRSEVGTLVGGLVVYGRLDDFGRAFMYAPIEPLVPSAPLLAMEKPC